MSSSSIVIYDSWISEIIEKETYRLNSSRYEALITNRETILELIRKPVFVYTKVDVSDVDSIEFYESLGFHLIETNTGFEKPVNVDQVYKGNCDLRFVNEEDEEGAVKVGRESFRYTRFHVDPKIDNVLANRLKAEWVRNYFRGRRGDFMIVSIVGGEVAGFLQLIKMGDGVLLIDLISVLPKYQRMGIAGDMIKYAEKECKGFTSIEVGTQVANIPSIRLYENLGFRLKKASYVFHYHKDSE